MIDSPKTSINKQFFILSYARSGSTLLRLTLNCHSNIVIPPECGYLHWIPKLHGLENSFETYIQALEKAKKFETWNLDLTALKAKHKKNDRVSFQNFIIELSQSIAPEKDIRYLGDKNNYFIDHIDDLVSFYPKALFIILLRNPFEILRSLRKLSEIPEDKKGIYFPRISFEPKVILEHYRKSYERVFYATRQMPSLLVNYEEFCSAPTDTISEILDFLDLPNESLANEHLKSSNEPIDMTSWKESTKMKITPSIYLQKCEYDEINQIRTSCDQQFQRVMSLFSEH